MTKNKVPREVAAQTPGVLLLPESSLRPLAYNEEAVQILSFPEQREGLPRDAADLALQIGSRLAPQSSNGARIFVQEFKSGDRTYTCRAIHVGSNIADDRTGAPNNTLILLERPEVPSSLRQQSAWDKFGLSQRERQMVELITKGMTTKEIANALQLSTNTVKSFLRLIMAKMGVSTRSGIVGKLLEAQRP